jgi:deazaflavin-dependent oxidoreductase (nitroreductase family)
MRAATTPGPTSVGPPPSRDELNKLLMPVMMWIHRRGGDRFQGMDRLYITTVGGRSGRQRTNLVARFDDGQGDWYVVASAGGAAQHPGWYHNLAAHPDRIWVQFGGTKRHVTVEQLSGDERSEVWEQVVARGTEFRSLPAQDRPRDPSAATHPSVMTPRSNRVVAEITPQGSLNLRRSPCGGPPRRLRVVAGGSGRAHG